MNCPYCDSSVEETNCKDKNRGKMVELECQNGHQAVAAFHDIEPATATKD